MFLKTRINQLKIDERGSTLVAVIGIFAVTVVISMVVGSAAINALGFTSATRAGVQSSASAEAGINFAVSQLMQGECQTTYTDADAAVALGIASVDVEFSVDIKSRPSSSAAWSNECPGNSSSEVRLLATGNATTPGIGDQTRGDLQRIEAVYSYNSAVAAIRPSGSAVYSYSSGTLNDAKILSEGSTPASIAIRTGSIDCTTSTVVQGDVIAHNGNIAIQSACTVEGSVLASGTVTIHGKVNQDVSSASTSESLISPNARIGGAVSLAGTVNNWGPRCPPPNNKWDDLGNACAAKKSTGATSVRINLTGADAPTAPDVPEWTDYAFIPSDWTDLGYTVVTWPGDSDHCKIDNRTKSFSYVTALNTYLTPVVIDATACSKLVFSSSANLNLALNTDIAFVAKGFNIESVTVNSANSTPRQLRFIVPDTASNGVPTCSGGKIDINSTVKIGNTVSALIYTPCTVRNSTVNWRGQMIAGNVKFDSNSGLVYSQIGLPGIDLDNSDDSGGTAASPGGLGELVSVRDFAP